MIRPAILVSLWLGCAAPAVAGTTEDLRAEFHAILYAPGVERPESVELKGYVLYPYVEAARLRAALAALKAPARDAELEKRLRVFLAAHAGEPVAEPVLKDWLLFLAGQQAWDEFLVHLPADTTDPALRCLTVSAHLARGELAGLRETALALWRESRNAPDACTPVFAWLENPGRLSAADIEQRAIFCAQNRLKLPASVARLPLARRMLMLEWDRLMNDPLRELEVALRKAEQFSQWPPADIAAALLEAFARGSRRDSARARALWPALEALPVFDAAQRTALKRLMALGFAYDFDVESLGLFGALPDEALDAMSREWRVRVALLHEDWLAAARWTDAMPEPQKSEPRWRYWHARALEKLGKEAEARALYERVAAEREYYAFLAAERLGRKPNLRPVALPDDRAEQAQLAARPPLARAKELLDADFPDLALPELRYGLANDTAATRIQAARLLSNWGWHAPALRMLAELQQWDDLALRYPLPFDAEVDAAAKLSGIAWNWIYAVLRTESLYDPRAVSNAQALGLLQLRLDTARAVARRAGLARPSREDLFVPAVNLALGARYLAELSARFGQRFIYMLAAYNAGPDKLAGWQPSRAIDADVWVENIPYNETRGYVQRALSSLVALTWRRTGKTADLLPLLQPVGADRQDAPP